MDNCGAKVTLSGWVQRVRDKGGMVWIDLRDRYGITQLKFEEGKTTQELLSRAKQSGREDVVQVEGVVEERYSKNPNLDTGDIEINVISLITLSASKVPPLLIEDETDGGEELRMKYRYLDIRRDPVKKALMLRHQLLQETRGYLSSQGFLEIETPVLIKSTPEGARDFVVPSRMNPGEFYALPQSPQTFKQLLMVGGLDKYFQLVKCFRDEDLRADRQPEFTQIDCEMSFVHRDDILDTFERLIKYLFLQIKGITIGDITRITYEEAMSKYGSDKPDTRFDMTICEMDKLVKGKGFNVFDQAEMVAGICVPGCSDYSRKQLDALTDYVKQPQLGAKGMVYIKYLADGTIKSSVNKFYSQDELLKVCSSIQASKGDLILILSGQREPTQMALGALRLHMGDLLQLRAYDRYQILWVVDFPLLEWDDETRRFHAKHHPFTSPSQEDLALLDTDPGKVRANAYDLVINGVEVGGGSIRIHNAETQQKMFKQLGFSQEEAHEQFGFLLDAFQFGAPPHGGIAFGFDRLCAIMGGTETIRDYIAFPKNNSGRDVMIDSPSPISREQLNELKIKIT